MCAITAMSWAVCVFVVFGWLSSTKASSLVTFEKTPDYVFPVYTQALTLRCSVSNTGDETMDGIILGRDVYSSYQGNVHTLNAITIYRFAKESDTQKEYLAGITHETAAMSFGNSQETNIMQVAGSVNGNTTELGYLQLSWKKPTYSQKGVYYCNVNGMGEFGHAVLFTKKIEVAVKNPDIQYLLMRIHDLEETQLMKINDLEETQLMKIHDLEETSKKEITGLKNETTHLKKELLRKTESADQELVVLHNEVTNLKQKLVDLKKEPSRSMHIEMGEVDCEYGDRENKNYHVSFKKPYDKVPRVYVTGVREFQKGEVVHYKFKISSKSTTGFDLYCGLRFKSLSYYVWVTWISLPSID